MLKFYLPINSYPNRILSRILVVSVLSSLGFFFGTTPNISGQFGSVTFGSAAYAQEFNDSDIGKFARAALPIEMKRRDTEQRIKDINGGNVPEIGCDQTENLNNLSGDVRSAVVDFCKFSADKIKENGLDVGQFNAIKLRYNSDPAVKKRVNQELRRLRG